MSAMLSICDRLIDLAILGASVWAVGKGCSMINPWLPYVSCGGIGILLIVGAKLIRNRRPKERPAK